jgi:hypothetical protein
MTKGDQLVERAANRLGSFARESAGETGLKGKLAEPLADDAELLRGMRPSRIAARLRGRPDDAALPSSAKEKPPAPLPSEHPRKKKSPRRGPPAIVLAVGAFALGLVIAKVVDWRGHAHPR